MPFGGLIVTYADWRWISPAEMSSATSFYTTFRQLMLSLGICVAALALHGSMNVQRHDVPEL